ncbi:MAG: Dyp-type peroxidase [Actinobacteria bacterium]|nr:Dyp-type peroxidase [Actinomycetota bacterium]
MPTPQPGLLTALGSHQWYVHLSRTDGADLSVIKSALNDLRADCQAQGVNLAVLCGPSFLAALTDDVPDDFLDYPGYESPDGKVAKGTQEDLLVWVHSDRKDRNWATQYSFRTAVAGHMAVARETIAWVYENSLDLTGFIDGTGNPDPDREVECALVPDGKPGAGGAFCIAQRWVHDLDYFFGLSLDDQQNLFGRTKADSSRLDTQVPTSHLSHVELRDGATADASKPKRGEMVRRSTPYAMPDGTVGLYFMGFCREQAPLRERMEAIYGMNGKPRDALTDYSTPASGSFYFAPSKETLDASLGA